MATSSRLEIQRFRYILRRATTPGTISLLIPVKDGGRPHLVATWGGTAFNFELTEPNFHTYIDSAVRYQVATSSAANRVVVP